MSKIKKVLWIVIAVVLIALISVSYVALFSEITDKEVKISELNEENVRLTSKIQRMEKEYDDKIEKLEKENDILKNASKESKADEDVETEGKNLVTESLLNAEIDKQEVRVISTNYIVQSTKHKALYPDMLQAVIINESEHDIKNAVVAFVAWDKNNLPVKIKGSIDFSDGAYIRKVNYADINLVPQDSFGSSSGYEIDENCGIVTFKAIVVSYETFDGKEWKNPLFSKWEKMYEGVKLTNVPE